uniref:Uncharacterized protein n=1 Tax=Oryza brachyantha TaxID=4533 RepID=J3KU32_ORYBR
MTRQIDRSIDHTACLLPCKNMEKTTTRQTGEQIALFAVCTCAFICSILQQSLEKTMQGRCNGYRSISSSSKKQEAINRINQDVRGPQPAESQNKFLIGS